LIGSAVFFVYILQSLRTGRFYVGQTDNLMVRFNQHRQGDVSSTKGYRPWWMPYYECFSSRADALRREREIKRKKSADSIRRLIAAGYAGLDLPAPPPPPL
jgi:putative endonuclease